MSPMMKEIFGYSVVGLAFCGVIVNIGALTILIFKRKNTIFHNLLKVLAFYDMLVCCGCALLYGFPNLWSFYATHLYRRLVPWVVPIVHMAMMSSVYSTMLMSFERYIRICHLCQLRNVSYITKENYKIYVILVVIIPILFYIPKFFEVRALEVTRTFNVVINCSDYLNMRPDHPGFQGLAQQSMVNFNSLNYPAECTSLPFGLNSTLPEVINITRQVNKVQLFPTKLRSNTSYYNIYCLALNTTFAMILPLLSLLFLNLKTVCELRKMMQDDFLSEQVHNVEKRNSHTSQSFRASRPSTVRGQSLRKFSSNRSSNRVPLLRRWSSSRKASMVTLKSNQAPPTTTSVSHEVDMELPCVDCLPEAEVRDRSRLDLPPRGPSASLQSSPARVNENLLSSSRKHVFNDEQRRAENRLTRIAMSIVWLFIFCHVWRLVPTLYESLHLGNLKVWPEWLSIINYISHTLIVFNSAVNFLIYVFM